MYSPPSVISFLGLSLLVSLLSGGAATVTKARADGRHEPFRCIPTAVFELEGELEVSCANRWPEDPRISWAGATVSALTPTQRSSFYSTVSTALLSGRVIYLQLSQQGCPVANASEPGKPPKIQCRLATNWSLVPFN